MQAPSSYDEMLVNAGFVKSSVIAIKDEKGTDTVPYIHAYTRMGDVCYIELDLADSNCNKNISNNNGHNGLGERMRATIRSGSVIPQQTKISVAQCANSSVCGVAFECNNEVCVLSPVECGDNMAASGLKEVTFVIAESLPTKNVQANGSPLAYPVVRLSEIKNSPEVAIQNVHIAAQAISTRAIGIATNNLAELARRANSVSNALNLLSSRWNEMHTQRCEEVSALEGHLQYWRSYCPPTCDSMAKEKAIVTDLCARAAALERYLQLQNRLSTLIPEMCRLEAIVNRSYADSYLTSRLNEPCQCRPSPEKWGYPPALANYDSDINVGRWPPVLNSWIASYRTNCPDAAIRLENLKETVERP
jgi:hypothetical protein